MPSATHSSHTAQPIGKVFLAFLLPMMLANVLQSLSGTLNNIFLGHMIGVKALAASLWLQAGHDP